MWIPRPCAAIILLFLLTGCRDTSLSTEPPTASLNFSASRLGHVQLSVAPLWSANAINDDGVVAGIGAAGAAIRYPSGRVVSLGVLPGGNWSSAYGINNRGRVIGQSNGTSVGGAFVWNEQDGLVDIGNLGGAVSPRSINDRGEVVGSAMRTDGTWTPFRWTPETGMTDLGALIGASGFGFAYDVSGSGQIVGKLFPEGPFVWDPSRGVSFLPSPLLSPLAINSSGRIVGYGGVRGETHAVAWSLETGVLDLGTFDGNYSEAFDISDDGTIVGWWSVFGNLPSGFIRKGGAWLDLGPGNFGAAVNRCGVTVGGAYLWVPAGRPLTGACQR